MSTMNIAIAGAMIWVAGCMLSAEDGLMASEADLAQGALDTTEGVESLILLPLEEEAEALEVSGDALATSEDRPPVPLLHLWECTVQYNACNPSTGVCRTHTYVGTDGNIGVALSNATQTCEAAHFATCTPVGCNPTH